MFSANSSQVSDENLYVEDVFSTWLYRGTGASQTITNGIDLAGKGGLVWIKDRTSTAGGGNGQVFYDTANSGFFLTSSGINGTSITGTSARTASLSSSVAFTSSGFTLGVDSAYSSTNYFTTDNYASWTFRKAPKFFDVVTYTGNGANRNIAHSLGVAPGCIIVKRTDSSANWQVYHRSNANTEYMVLNGTVAVATGATRWNSTTPTSSVFTVGTDATVNASGGTYTAYLFAHDEMSNGIIQCGSYTGNGITPGPKISLGWEPQFVMIKNATGTGNWLMFDAIRGMPIGSVDPVLYANGTVSETITTDYLRATETGFQIDNNSTVTDVNTNGSTYIYIAIRRGLMRTPTSGATVFQPITYTGTNLDNRLVNTGIVTDMTMARIRDTTSLGSFYVADRMRGNLSLGTAITSVESNDADSFMTPNATIGTTFASMVGFGVGNDPTRLLNGSSTNQLAYAFRRAKGFFDIVCYSGNSVAGRTINHALGVVPELMIVKRRDQSGSSWYVYTGDANNTLFLEQVVAQTSTTAWNNTAPTSSVFSVGNGADFNQTGSNYVAYLFASVPGVSKVGSYTGNGTSQTINCSFAAGARFVMIKRVSGAGYWYVWDAARGIVTGNDLYLILNATGGEVSIYDSVDTDSSGFVINQDAGTNINVNNATYIYLAIA